MMERKGVPSAHDDLTDCLLILARWQGIETTREALVSGLPLTNGKLAPSVFHRAASRLGFVSRVVRRELHELNTTLFPVLIMLKDGRTCLLCERDDNGVHKLMFVDLPDAAVQYSASELVEIYSGLAIYCRLESPLNQTRVGVPAGTRRHWFWDVIRENRAVYRDVLVAALFINLFAVAMPLFVMNVYDRVVPNHATETLWVLAAGVFLVFSADLCLRMLRSWFLDLAASRADIKLSAGVMTHVMGLRLEAQPGSVGSFASSINGFENVRAFFSSMTLIALIDLPFVLLFVLIMALIAVPLAIPVLVGATVVILYSLTVQRSMHRLSEEVWQAGAHRNGLLVEHLQGLDTVKSFNAESRFQLAWERVTIFLADRGRRLRTLGASVSSGAQWVQQTVAIAVVVLGVYLLIAGELSQGGLIAAYLLSSRAMAPVSQAAGLLLQYFQASNSLASLDELMAKPSERPAGKRWVTRPVIEGALQLQGVSLTYPGAEQPAVHGVSLTVSPGEHVALVGKTGSGKSTLQKLVSGLYQPTSGKVIVDGANISQIDPAELRRSIGYISQDIQLFSGTLLENITLGKPHATQGSLTRAINISGLANFIKSHPDGLNMQVGERGQFLSGGQRQSVAIARAVIHEPRILLFDEPSSFLDTALEDHLKEQLQRFIRRRTLILVTHRGSMLDLVDRLVVMDEGRIVSDGPKSEVLAALQAGQVARKGASR